MKKLYFSLTLLFSSILISNTFNVNSQLASSVNIGTGTVTGQAIPIEPYYGYTYSQSIYLASEIGGAIDPITAVQFYATANTTLASSDLWDVWIKEVPTTFADFNSQNFEEISTFTQVFSGQVTINNGVVRIEFSTPFTYSGTGNIIIAVDQNRPGYDSGTHDFYCTGSGNGDYRAVAYRSDGTNPDPATAHTAFAGVNNGRTSYPNITFISEQESIDIGSGTVTGQAIPVEPYYGYTYSQSLYLASEIGGVSGPITGVKFYATANTTLANSDLWDVWIKEVPTTFADFNSQNFEEISTFTQVFSGQVTINNGVVRIEFSTPFTYSGTGNIIIAVDQNRPGYDSGTHDFYCTGSGNGDYRAVAYRSDGTNPDPATAHTAFAGVNNGRTSYPNITFLSESCSPATSLAASNLTTNSADISWTPSGSEISYNLEYGPTGFSQGAGTSSTFSAIGKIANNPNSLFVGGANATWSYIHPLVITTDGAASQAAQTYTINVTSLPAGGAKARLIKSTANGGAAFTPAATGQALVLGPNTFNAGAVSFNRYVKIQFNNDQFEFDAISVNGTSVYSSNSTLLSGLTSATTYDVYVQGDCGSGSTSTFTGPLSFTTPCGSAGVPFSEGFSSTLPNCWSMSGGENWLFNTSGPNHVGNLGNLSGSTFSGGHYAVIDASGYSGAGGSSLLESPIIDVSSLTNPELTFYLISDEEGTGYSSTLTVEANGGSSWDTIGSYTGNTAGWEQKTISLSAYSSTVQLRFGFSEQSISSAYYDDIAIDDIDVHETPSCFAASGLSSSNITAGTADLSWTASNSSNFNVEYGPNNFIQGSGTTVTASLDETTISAQSSLFTSGPAAWPYVYSIVTTSDGAASQAAQSFSINVTSLPTGGANFRLIKQTANGGAAFQPNGTGQALVLGLNTFTAAAVSFNRYVKIQFDSDQFGFDAMSANGNSVYSSTSGSTSLSGLSPNTQYDFYVQNDCGAAGLSTWSAPSSFTTSPSPTSIPTCEDFETGSPGASTALNAAANASATVIAGAAANSSAYGVQLTGPDAFVPGAWTGGSSSTTEAQAWGTNVTTHSNIAFNVDATAESVVILTFDLRQTYTFGPKYSWFRVTVNGTQIGASINPISNTDPFVNQSYDLSAYAGTNFNLKLEHAGKYSPAYSTAYPGDRALIDNICISAPNCLAPTALTSSAITATSANLLWTVNGTETAWEVEYGPFGYTQGSGTTSAISSANTSLTGLTAQTQYDVYVRADCGSGSTSSWVGPYTFTTACAAAAAPYLENFDAGFPLCWSQSTTDNFNWTLDANGTPSSSTGPSDDITSGGNYMYIETSSGANGDSAVLLSQAIDLSALTVPQLRFYSHMYGGTINTLTVDISTDAGVTFTQVFTKSGDQGNQWNEEFVDLSSYSGTVLFRITGSRGASFSGDIAIDNFEIREAPACVAPTSLTTANLTNSSVDISWTAGGTETAWNIEYGPDGFTQGSGTSLPLSATTASLTGLTALTEYDFYVQADCGRGLTSTWNGPYSFTIPGPGDCSSSVTYSYSSNSTLASSLKGFVANTPGDYITLTFTAGSSETNYDYWYVNDAANGNGNTIATGDGSITSVNGGIFESTTGEISFYVISDGSVTGTPFVFSASCAAPPACANPTLLTASNLTDTTADISWTAGGTETAWNFEYGTAGFSQGTGTISALSSANISLTGLTPNTQYDVYVQADCGSGTTSGWTGPFTFTTECSILTTFPYTMGFENGFGCWSTVDVNGGNSWGAYTAQGLGGTIAAGIQYQSSAHDDHLISPKFSVTSNSSRFSFNATDYFNYPESFDVLVSTTGKAAADFTDTISSEVASGGYSYYQYDLSSYIGQNIYVSIHSTSTNQYYLFVDDVTIDEYVSKTITQNETSCNPTYSWSVNGTTYSSDTNLTVFSPAVNVADADSTFILNLAFTTSYSVIETVTACDSFVWYGNTYTSDNNIATYTAQTSAGCDSIITLNLTINNSSVSTETATECDSYVWNGTTYNTTGNYTFLTTNSNGCDSTATLTLTVNYSGSSSILVTECGSYDWSISQTTYDSSGVYINSDTNSAGCSQIDTLVLTINPEYNDTISVTACDTYTWLVNGNTYTSSTTSDSLYQSINGCDSLVTLDLTIINSTIGTETVTACDSAIWNGTTYTSSGNYSFNASPGSNSCDSTANLVLTLNSSSSSSLTNTACNSYDWNGNTYTSSGTYFDTTTNSANCPQYDTLVLIITTTGSVNTQVVCDSFPWNGNTYTTSGNYEYQGVGCTDSLYLTVNYSNSSSSNLTACDSSSWNGITYFSSGTYDYFTTNVSGCDSIATINLTINNSSTITETATECDSYVWQGNTYTSSGNYTFVTTNSDNCDSTVNLSLTVNTSSSSLLTTTSCNSYFWKGNLLDSSGIYSVTGTNLFGCNQYDTLDLTISTFVSSNDVVTACDSYDWGGLMYFTSGTYSQTGLTSSTGCDSTANLNLTINSSVSNTLTEVACDSYNWNGMTYTTSGVYSGVFQTSTGCDSTVNLVLTINSSSNQSVTVFSCDEYVWDGVSYTASGDYTNNYTSASGCDSTVTLVLTLGTTAAPFTEGFDINFPNCWSQPDSADGEDALDWTRNSFATFSPGTGPSDDVIGGGHYMYIESSLPAQHGDNAIMYSNFIDISSLTNPELRFFSHMYGESTGSLTVEIQGENDTVPTTIFSKSGDHGDLWVQERVTFSSTSNRVKFKITGILDSNSLGAVWAGDMAIDEFGVREAVPNDLAIIAAAVNSDCELTTTEPIELWVVNNGLVDQANFKLSYSINGGAPVLDSIIQFVNIGDTLRHTFTATADMSMDGIYDIDFECILAIDADATDNVLNFVAENYTTPADAVTEGDTICFVGDFGQVSALGDGWIYWYDSLVGGSLVGENDTLSVTPSATTSYFAEVSVYDGFEEDFESYTPGDLIAQSSNDWNTWSDPNGGADDDAEVTDFVSAGGSNSLYLNDDYSDDIVLPLGNTYSSGTFNFETDMYIETNAYLNFQEGVVNGEAWAFDIYFNDTTINVEIDDSTVLTVAYNPNNPLGAPVWFNFSLQADLDNGQWKMFKDGVSLGSFAMNDEISSVNFWASTGNDYYIDNVKWGAWGGEACRSLSRTEAVVVLDSCNTTSVSEVSFENLKIYPNPNNGSFTIANSELINSVVIMDLQGKVVYRNSNLNLYNLNVNLENLDRGMYMINIISENEIITKSIIVN